MKFSKSAVLVAVLGTLATPSVFATNGYFAHGYGMKAKGMAGVGVALPQDALAAATNPAGMVLVGDRMDFGLDLFRPDRGAEISGNVFPGVDGKYKGSDTKYFPIPEFGYNHLYNESSSIGVSIFGNGGMNTDYKQNPFAGFGATGSAGVDLAQLFVSPTWATKLNENHAVGISLNLAYQRFKAKGIQPFAGLSSNPSAVSNNGYDNSTGYGVRVGWTGKIGSNLSLGATLQSETKMSKFNKYSGLFAEQGDFDIPANYAVGMAYSVGSDTVIAVDWQKIKYSNVKSINNTSSQGGPLGADNGAGFGWEDVRTIKLGVSHQYNSNLLLRAGFSHNKQPIPPSQTFFNILAPGVVEDHLTLGSTFILADKSEITLAYMHAFKKTVNGSGSIPPGFPPGFGGGEANLNMYQNSIGIAYGW